MKERGSYVNGGMCEKVRLGEDSGRMGVVVKWEEKVNMYVGDLE